MHSPGKWYLKMKILLFAPHSGIWVHTFPEGIIAEALAKQGHEIIYVTCEKSLAGFCTVMSAFGLNNQSDSRAKQEICTTCQQYKNLVTDTLKFKNYSIEDQLKHSDREEINAILKNITKENFLEYTLEGIEIGRLTLYQMLLEFKKNSTQFTEAEWERFLIDLKNALMVFFSAKRFLLNEKPDAVIVYNSLYSVNHVFCKLAENFNIKQYFLHAGGNLATRLETMILAEGDGFKYYKKLLKRWHDFKTIPCSEALLSKVSAHLLTAIRGESIFSYSAAVAADQVDIRNYFNIAPHQKIVLATMSSNDERFASAMVKAYTQSNTVLFENQFLWLKSVVDYVKDRHDICLIIRVHPRECSNRRDSVVSENYSQMQELFKNVPANVKINWPEDKISLYHLAQEIDVCLNSWSSAGKELAAFGLPVILYSEELQVYPPDINMLGETLEEYYALFEKALISGWDIERCRKAFRWYAFEYFRTTLDISDSYPMAKASFASRVYKKYLRTIDKLAIQKRDLNKRSKHLKAASMINRILEGKKESILDLLDEQPMETTTLEQETHCLQIQLQGIAKVLMQNNTKITPLLLKIKTFLEKTESQYA